jgi:hypothetical protein
VKRSLPLISFALFAIVIVGVFMARVVRENRAAQEALAAQPSITGKRSKVIAKLHSPGDTNAMIFVYAVEKQHRFPNGDIKEGWLVEPAHLVGESDPIWSIKPKGSVEWLVPTEQQVK